ncbi:retropepsin-like aspartic protease [Oleiagrimonas sp. C23AA]|uniref:retropepsin-like aspartic protease n=1 Tax=Oleiagrimonas sp. C23AA TaxID=2719047 RepID=UPI001420E09C|nr:retropepsin-like aspartic protease [Oleiagrimonas sp. C23AA]NII10029.1 hypothetical protein [Oleiagrimonas sp. C23AA]
MEKIHFSCFFFCVLAILPMGKALGWTRPGEVAASTRVGEHPFMEHRGKSTQEPKGKAYGVVGGAHRFAIEGGVKSLEGRCPQTNKPYKNGAKAIPFRFINNLIYVNAKVDGHDLLMLLDTGGGTSLTPRAAAKAGMMVHHRLFKPNLSTPKRRMAYVKVKHFRLGKNIKIKEKTMPVVAPFGYPVVDGILGSKTFHNFVVTIDYYHKLISFIRKSSFLPQCAGEPIDLSFFYTTSDGAVAKLPVVEGVLDGLKSKFWIDTGSWLPVIMLTPYAEKHDLYTRYHASEVADSALRAGGILRARRATGRYLRLGNVTIRRPHLYLSVDKDGPFAFGRFGGNIGSGLLKNYIVTFDFSHKRMYLRKSDQP